MSPPHPIFFKASHWLSDHMISSRPLIGQPSSPTPLPRPPAQRPPPPDILFCIYCHDILREKSFTEKVKGFDCTSYVMW